MNESCGVGSPTPQFSELRVEIFDVRTQSVIDGIRRDLASVGWHVEDAYWTNPRYAGLISFERRTVYVNSRLPAHVQMLTLLHELGHYVAYARGYRSHGDRARCERRAYCYGWACVRTYAIWISRRSWRAFHEELFTHEGARRLAQALPVDMKR